jgi:hypothetical protein
MKILIQTIICAWIISSCNALNTNIREAKLSHYGIYSDNFINDTSFHAEIVFIGYEYNYFTNNLNDSLPKFSLLLYNGTKNKIALEFPCNWDSSFFKDSLIFEFRIFEDSCKRFHYFFGDLRDSVIGFDCREILIALDSRKKLEIPFHIYSESKFDIFDGQRINSSSCKKFKYFLSFYYYYNDHKWSKIKYQIETNYF